MATCPYCHNSLEILFASDCQAIVQCPYCQNWAFRIYEEETWVTQKQYESHYQELIYSEWQDLFARYDFVSSAKKKLGSNFTIWELAELLLKKKVSKRVHVHKVSDPEFCDDELDDVLGIIDVCAASARQMAYLESLGFHIDYLLTRSEAHILLDGILAGLIPPNGERLPWDENKFTLPKMLELYESRLQNNITLPFFSIPPLPLKLLKSGQKPTDFDETAKGCCGCIIMLLLVFFLASRCDTNSPPPADQIVPQPTVDTIDDPEETPSVDVSDETKEPEIPSEETVKVEESIEEPTTPGKLETEPDEKGSDPILQYKIQKVKTGSVKINRKWFKMRDDILIEKFGVYTGNEMIRYRSAASPKERNQHPQAVMMTGEMWEVWEEVKDEIEQRAKTKEFVFQKEPEECVFPIGPGLYCVEVPIRYTSKSGKKKETTLTFQVEVP